MFANFFIGDDVFFCVHVAGIDGRQIHFHIRRRLFTIRSDSFSLTHKITIIYTIDCVRSLSFALFISVALAVSVLAKVFGTKLYAFKGEKLLFVSE